MKFCGFRRFNVNPSGAPRQLPLHKGAYDCTCFFLCATEKTKGKFKTSTPKNSRKTKVAHSPLGAPRQLPPGGSLCLCVFFLCAAKKTKGIFRTSKAKICTFFLCGSAVRRYAPSSGRKVARVSVTKGARGTERRQEAEAFRRFNSNLSPASRQSSLPQGSHELMRFFLCAAEKTKGKFKTSPPKKQQKTASRALSFRRSAPAPSRREPMFVCFFLCTAEKTNAEFKFSKLKVCTLFFCGTVARHPLPSSGRKVSRVSVTEGACETKRQQNFSFFAPPSDTE